MIRAPRRATVAAYTAAIVLTAPLLVTGCGSGSGAVPTGQRSTTEEAKAQEPAQRVLNATSLETALPNHHSIPAELQTRGEPRAHDNFDAVHCQDDGWPDEWCGEALAVGSSAFTNIDDQELVFRLISFSDATTAERLFQGEGTPDEVGESPPGDQIDGFEIESPDGLTWPGKGINVRQGAVIAKIEYTWEDGTDIPSDRLMSLADMVVQRIQQAQAGKPPTASAR